MLPQSANTISPTNYCIDFRNVTVVQNNYCILDNINIQLSESRIGIVGNNGSGKSTFARCACGLVPFTNKQSTKAIMQATTEQGNFRSRKQGKKVSSKQAQNREQSQIFIHSNPLAFYKNHIWKHINMTFQIPDQQIIMPSVQEELELGLKHCGFDKALVQEKIDYALDILKVNGEKSCHSLSAGQKRLLCILSILLIEPQTIILDEPTTFLDMAAKVQIMEFVAQLPQQIILITHDLFLIEKFPYIVCFENGKIFAQGTYAETVKEYKTLW